MKKLVIFFILFIFSMPAFAQNESSFTENFSLIRDHGANNHAFFYSNIICPNNYLFFAENRRYSRLHQLFQIYRSQKSSDLTPLSNIAAVEGGRQNWRNRQDLIYGQEENISSEEKPESLAEGYLKRLAERSKRSRKTWGTIWLIGGGAYLALGATMISSADEDDGWGGLFAGMFGTMAIASGAVMAGVGVYKWAIWSGAERELEDVLSISDPGHRERASHETLSSLATRGRRRRILWGIIWAGFSTLAFFSDEGSFLLAAEYGGLAVYNLMRKSRAERAFKSYLKEKEFQDKLEFRLGIMPYGGVKIGFVYSF
ncbi:MAG: hypothetical protein E3J56_14815 [Candidatus Aminicenantes bacterium]|nr:MAG: hypothetical protein E3J56_14815 [Candidatus Aminicenantes bacterium]